MIFKKFKRDNVNYNKNKFKKFTIQRLKIKFNKKKRM